MCKLGLGRGLATLGVLCLTLSTLAGPTSGQIDRADQDEYHDVVLSSLELLDPSPGVPDWPWRDQAAKLLLEPRVQLDHGGEAYLTNARPDWRADSALDMATGGGRFIGGLQGLRLHLRVPAGELIEGRLLLPDAGYSRLLEFPFRLAAGEPALEHRTTFLEARVAHYERKLAAGLPGAAWFRHQAELARAELESPGTEPAERANRFRWTSRDELDESFELFSGGRALSENLALDRELDDGSAGAKAADQRSVPLDDVHGITVPAFDWTELVAGIEPELDPLARWIPADQHALFLPSFDALTTLLDEAHANGTPVLRLLEARAEDARTQARYERQLCLPLDGIARLFGPSMIKSVAITGSDPYLRTGTALTMLFEASQPDMLLAAIRANQAAALEEDSEVRAIGGSFGGSSAETTWRFDWEGVRSNDASISSYLALVGETLVVTNSRTQLEALAAMQAGELASLASLDEYAFFRDRYPRGAPGETAFFMLSDATIRRWLGPEWRIGASRRTRAAAVLSQHQAANALGLVHGEAGSAVLEARPSAPGGGSVTLTPGGVTDSVFGHLGFLTPIAELGITRVTEAERNGYGRFLRGYENQWRVFDPIAASVGVGADGLELDLSVLPLVIGSDYADLVELTSGVKLEPTAGDPHAGALLSYIVALNKDADQVRDADGMASMMLPGVGGNALGWIGDYFTFYLERSSFWEELGATAESAGAGQAEDATGDFMEANLGRLPIAMQVGIRSPLRLATFLTSARAYIESSVPDLLVWETLAHADRSYVRISLASPESWFGQDLDLGLHYVVLPDALVLAIDPVLIHDAIDRRKQPSKDDGGGGAQPVPATERAPEPWLGDSMALRLDLDLDASVLRLGLLAFLGGESPEVELRLKSWKALPILEEWKRLFPDRDPLEVHEQLWHTRLVCPGGGEYVWNAEAGAMESSVFGRPDAPKPGPGLLEALADLTGLDFGVTFEHDGLRARARLERRPR